MDVKLLFVGASFMGIHPQKCKASAANLFFSWCVRLGCINEPFFFFFKVSLFFFKPEKVFPSQLPTLQGITHHIIQIQTCQLPPEPKSLRSSWFLNFPSNLSVSYECKLMCHHFFNCSWSWHGFSLKPHTYVTGNSHVHPRLVLSIHRVPRRLLMRRPSAPSPVPGQKDQNPSALLDLERSAKMECVLHVNVGDKETFFHPSSLKLHKLIKQLIKSEMEGLCQHGQRYSYKRSSSFKGF